MLCVGKVEKCISMEFVIAAGEYMDEQNTPGKYAGQNPEITFIRVHRILLLEYSLVSISQDNPVR